MKKYVIIFLMLLITLGFILSNFSTISADEPPVSFTTTGFELGDGEFISALIEMVDPIDSADENVIAFDISNGQSTSSFDSFIDDLQSMGYTVATIDITIDGIPDNVEKLIISSVFYSGAYEPYTISEAMMLEQWVDDGGELLVLAEWGPDFTENTDEICAQFGITQNSDQIIDTDDYDSVDFWVLYEGYNLDSTHPILFDVNSIVFYSGCSFDATDGVIIRTDDDGTATPFDAPAAIAKDWGNGRVAIFGDYDWISSHYGDYDNAKMAINTIIWLNGIITPPAGAESIRLIAGQDIYVGDVFVWNDNDNFHVLYRTFDDWYLLETHLQVNKTEPEIPQNKPGNPIPGHFEFSELFGITDYVSDWYISFPIPDNMEYGETIVIAAHAEVAHISKGCLEIVSDITTQSMGLTSGKPVGDSFYAWEYPDWSIPKSEFTLGADWIWESEYVFDPEIDNWVLFTKDFIIPGLYPIELLGDMKITCDNEYYTLSLNWLTVGSDDIWQTVETYDISDKLDVGVNEFEIIAKNLGVEGSTVTTNPGGLIYESEVCYEVVDQEESAWGEGIQFSPHPKRNWGMYFEYTINYPPVAVIEPIDPSVPWCDPVYFDGTLSYDPDGIVVAYYWDFGDGTNSFNPMPVHYYPGIGTYTVTLTVTDNEGATDSESTTVTVYNTPPVADFWYDQSIYQEWCEPIYFYDESYDLDDCDTLTYYWDFGDEIGTSTIQNPTYTYSEPGIFTVTLTVTDGWGDSDTYIDTVTVINTPPEADFEWDPYLPYWCEEVEFDGTYSDEYDYCDYIVLYEWDFDDDGVYDETGVYAYYTFPGGGDYPVTLRVTDGAGETDTQTFDVEVWSEPPSADFEWDPPGAYWCTEVEFDGSLSYEYDGCDSIAVYEWDFDDDGIYDDTGMYAYHTFWVGGDYPVTLRVTDQSGLTDTKTYTVPIWSEPPSADFEWDPPGAYWCTEVEFDGSSSYEYDGCDSIAVYEWDFDDDGIYDDTGMYAYHTFWVGGDYPVTLRVTDQSGLTDTQTYTVPIWSEPPSADFEWNPPSPYQDEVVEFDGSSSYEYDGCDSIAVYEWDFDNDGIYDDTGMYAYHTFLAADDYPVTLRVTDQSGLTDTKTYIVTVYSLPP